MNPGIIEYMTAKQRPARPPRSACILIGIAIVATLVANMVLSRGDFTYPVSSTRISGHAFQGWPVFFLLYAAAGSLIIALLIPPRFSVVLQFVALAIVVLASCALLMNPGGFGHANATAGWEANELICRVVFDRSFDAVCVAIACLVLTAISSLVHAFLTAVDEADHHFAALRDVPIANKRNAGKRT